MTYMNIAEGFSYVDDEYLCMVEQVKKQRKTWRIALKRVAMFFLALLVGASVWLAVDEGARAAFQRWVREVYENSVVYRFFGSPEEAFPQYELKWVPEGYELESEIESVDSNNKQKDILYENRETGDSFIFSYQSFSEDISMTIGGYEDQAMPESEPCTINGLDGTYYPKDCFGVSNLVWTDDKHGIVLSIDSTLDKDTMLR
ncbi:MAG: DUF4367 domain-containing protein, partial [Oscillospiraceae bacterium]|nr:DUF4367 domain-containing protein [Oscillospiraceae bacterium]